jgi:signal transduction histidine kinase
MSAEAQIIETPLAPVELSLLQDALTRFGESSARLQAKYEMLAQETQNLKQQLEYERGEGVEQARLWALGQVSGAMAHEIRNPLGAMRIFVALLAQELTENESASELIQHIESSMVSLESVLNNMLHFSQRKPLQLIPVNLAAIVSHSFAEFQTVFPSMQCTYDSGATDFYVLAHEESLRQVFRNLFKNAAEASDGQGEVIVRCFQRVGSIIVQVSDNGPGIPEEHHGRIFEPFVSSKNHGTGLGLAIVKRLLLKQRADIELLDDAPTTTFEMTFNCKTLHEAQAS